jgi:hypothetical protein
LTHAALAAAVLATLTGCPRKKPSTEVDAGVAETPVVDAAPAPLAANEADVTRFPDETKLDRVAATVLAGVTNVRKAPPSGAVITTIPKGTVVLEHAQKDKFFLVSFDDPKDPTKKLMGWVFQDAFSATPSVPQKPPGVNPCPAGQQLLIAEQDFCGKVCKVAADCPNGQACTGSAKLFGLNGKVGEPVSVCSFLAGIPDGGTAPPPVADAGAKIVIDAGTAKPGAGAATDAGVPSQTVAGVQEPPDASGKCPANFVLVASDKLCHRTCNAPNGVECPAKSRCNGTLAKDRVCVVK